MTQDEAMELASSFQDPVRLVLAARDWEQLQDYLKRPAKPVPQLVELLKAAHVERLLGPDRGSPV